MLAKNISACEVKTNREEFCVDRTIYQKRSVCCKPCSAYDFAFKGQHILLVCFRLNMLYGTLFAYVHLQVLHALIMNIHDASASFKTKKIVTYSTRCSTVSAVALKWSVVCVYCVQMCFVCHKIGEL